ncbi:KR domain-containing protein, partial [Pelosinus sp. Bkl1]
MMKNKRKENILIQIVVVKQNEGRLFSGFSGLLKTAQLENPKLRGQIIEVDQEEETGEVVKKLEENSYSLDYQIRYQNEKRYVMEWKEIEDSQEKSSIPWKDQGVYLITGGIGGLGRIFTREIISKAKDTTIILTGRSPLNEEKRGTLKELEAKGGKIEYKQVDVTDKKGIAHL